MKRKNKIILFTAILALFIVLGGILIYVFAHYIPEKKKEAENQKKVEEYVNQKLELYREENEKYDDYEVDVAFLGDSLTDGYDVEKYYPEYLVVNRGIGGDTTFTLEKRLKVSVYDLKPKAVVLLIGGNNLKSMFDNYEKMILGLKENLPKTKIILVSLTAMGMSWAEKNQLAALNNVKIKILADKHGLEFVDLYTPMYNIETNEIFAEYTTDGAHQTPQGYEVFTKTIKPVIKKVLEK